MSLPKLRLCSGLFTSIVFTFISFDVAGSTSATAVVAPVAAKAVEPPLQWRDVTGWGAEGRAWIDLERRSWFDRLPATAQARVTPAVWELGRDSAGLLVRFKTDAALIWADYTLTKEKITRPNMTPIGNSGLDLYARDESGRWRWVGVTRPEAIGVRQEMIAGLAPIFREYAVYLPLYNGVKNLSIGVPPDARFEGLAPRTEPPLVFYGTSITQGASASRPGMVHTAILGRRFDRPVVNLGFSGNGRMDAAVGELLGQIDAAVYVIDCLPNMDAAAVREKCLPLVRQLRAAKPRTPIVLVEDRRHTNSWIVAQRDRAHQANHAALRECYATLEREGMPGIFYLPGDDLLGHDDEGTTDGSHPNDLGFVRQADLFEPVLQAALAWGAGQSAAKAR